MKTKFLRLLMASAFCVSASAETFVVAVEQDAGFVLETEWKDKVSLFESRLSTGERALPPLVSPAIWLKVQEREHRETLASIFVDTERAGAQAECQMNVLFVICRKAQDLAIKARDFSVSKSNAFISKPGYVACIDGMSGRGACREVAPVSTPTPTVPKS
jgi:hypothetical protein